MRINRIWVGRLTALAVTAVLVGCGGSDKGGGTGGRDGSSAAGGSGGRGGTGGGSGGSTGGSEGSTGGSFGGGTGGRRQRRERWQRGKRGNGRAHADGRGHGDRWWRDAGCGADGHAAGAGHREDPRSLEGRGHRHGGDARRQRPQPAHVPGARLGRRHLGRKRRVSFPAPAGDRRRGDRRPPDRHRAHQPGRQGRGDVPGEHGTRQPERVHARVPDADQRRGRGQRQGDPAAVPGQEERHHHWLRRPGIAQPGRRWTPRRCGCA